MLDVVLVAWRAYQADMRPETRNDFLRSMMTAYPPLLSPDSIVPIQEEPNHRFTPEGRVAYPPLTITEATEKHFLIEGDHYGYNGLDGFIAKGSIRHE